MTGIAGPMRLLTLVSACGAVACRGIEIEVAEEGGARWTRVDDATGRLSFDAATVTRRAGEPPSAIARYWLDRATLEDAAGRSLVLGCCGRETATFTVPLQEIARAGLGDAPWKLTAVDRLRDEWRSWPVEVDAGSVAAVRALQAGAAARAGAAAIDVASPEALAAALQRAPAGATVRLPAGEWRVLEKFVRNGGITLVGAGRDKTAVMSCDGQPLLSCRTPAGERLELRGITFDGMSQECTDGLVELHGTAVVTDCAFINARPTSRVEADDWAGISPRDGDNLDVTGSDIEFRDCFFGASDSSNFVATLKPGDRCRFDACIFSGGKKGPSLGAPKGAGPGFADVTFRHCDFSGAWDYSLFLSSGMRARVEQCVFRSGRVAVWGIGETQIEVVDTLIEESSYCAIQATQGARFEVRGCTIRSAPTAILHSQHVPTLSDNRFEQVGREMAPEEEAGRQ